MKHNNTQSIVDLSISLMIIFILLFVGMLQKVKKAQAEIASIKTQYEPLNREPSDAKAAEEKQQGKEDTEKIRQLLKGYDIDAQINGNTVLFDLVEDKLNFKFDSSELNVKGKRFLDKFIPANAAMWCGKMARRIQAVQIVGYTDSYGPDEYNLKLSLDRALSVMNYAINETQISPATQDCLFNLITINGRGERGLLPAGSKPGHEDPARSRRVEFKIMLAPQRGS